MRKIIFREIGMENYGPYTEPFILECPENSLTLITGPNGVGKTIAMDSMSFTFYGTTSKNERGDDVVNNQVGKNCHTWVKFEDSDGNTYVCDRYHKHSKYKNTARLTRNGEDKPYRVGHREVSAEIDRLICDRKTFTNTLMFGQKVKDFFTDLTDTAQKDIFWKLLDLLKYKHYQATAKTESDKTEKTIQSTLNEIEVAKGIIENLESQIEEENKRADAFEIDRKRMLDTLNESIGDMKTLIKTTEEALEKIPDEDLKPLQEAVFILKGKLENVGQDAANIKKEVEAEGYKKVNELTDTRNQKQKEVSAKYQKQREDIESQEEETRNANATILSEIKEKQKSVELESSGHTATISGNNNQIEKLKSTDLEIGSPCPTCLEAITKKSIENIESIIGKLIQENQGHMQTLESLQKQYDELESEWAREHLDGNDKMSTLAQKKMELKAKEEAELKAIENRLSELKQQIADVANNTLKERIQELEVNAQKMQSDLTKAESVYFEAEKNFKDRQAIQQKLTEYNTKVDGFKDQIKTTEEKEFDESQLKHLKNSKQQKLKEIEDSKAKVSEVEAEIKRLAFWKEAFSKSGIPSMLIDQAVPLMNASMRKYLDLLSNGRYIVTFDTISQTKGGEYRDKFSVNVLDTKTQVNNRKQLSGGQTRLIDIATILTLRDLKAELGEVEFNLFGFDEIFDALDDSNIGYVCGILNSLKENRSLLVISHRHQDELEADNHIQLT